MFKSTRHFYALLSLVLVLALPGLVMAKAVIDRVNGTVWQVDIAGFDPRDLLRGHYLMFSYEWDIKGDQKECGAQSPCCLCLTEKTPGTRANPDAHFIDCGAPAARECPGLIRGKRSWNGVTMPNQTYFVPETHALALEHLLRGGAHDFKMAITVPHGGGVPTIRGLLIDGVPVEEFVRQNPVSPEPAP